MGNTTTVAPPAPEEAELLWFHEKRNLWHYMFKHQFNHADGEVEEMLLLKWWDGEHWQDSAAFSPSAHAELLRVATQNKKLEDGLARIKNMIVRKYPSEGHYKAAANLDDEAITMIVDDLLSSPQGQA